MTWDLTKLGWFSCALLLEKSVLRPTVFGTFKSLLLLPLTQEVTKQGIYTPGIEPGTCSMYGNTA